MADSNPYHDCLIATRDALNDAGIEGSPEFQVRELPWKLGHETLPLGLVCPAQRGKKIKKQTFGKVWWLFPVVVLLITAGNRTSATSVESRLQTDWDVTNALFVPKIAGVDQIEDVDVDPAIVADLQAALGTNYIVSGLTILCRVVADKEGEVE